MRIDFFTDRTFCELHNKLIKTILFSIIKKKDLKVAEELEIKANYVRLYQ
jgi:hypothetical protein